jgi:DtxR family Mn-dependent transcriptional regulator
MIVLYTLIGILILIIGYYLLRRDRKYRGRLERVYYEDVLKFIFHRNERGFPASIESLKGALSLPTKTIYKILDQLEQKNLVQLTSAGIELKSEGRPVVLDIIRAHRLWETYLEHETDLPIHKIHKMAEAKEHELNSDQLEALNAHLGFPVTDPHGDPIPTADHQIEKMDIKALADLKVGDMALIHHIEDEPYKISKKLFKLGLRPNQIINIVDRQDGQIRIQAGDEQHTLSTFEALNIQIVAHSGAIPKRNKNLLDLDAKDTGVVIGVSHTIQGLARRRLLDLGITPGAKITRSLISSFGGDPVAYSIRGAKIALRKEQAKNIFIEKV